jgi:hypothetical protein
MIRATEEDRRRYDDAVLRVAHGKRISPTELAAILARVGMTQSELDEDVSILKRGESMSADLIESLRKQQTQASEAYKRLIDDAVSGKEVPADEAAKVLRAASKTVEDLERDVARARRIQELQQIIDDEAGLREERIALQREQGQKLKRLIEEEREWADRKLKVEGEYSTAMGELDRREQRLIEAKRELFTLTRQPQRKEPELPSWRPGFAFPPGGESLDLSTNYTALTDFAPEPQASKPAEAVPSNLE